MRFILILVLFFAVLFFATGFLLGHAAPLTLAFVNSDIVIGTLPVWAWIYLAGLIGFVMGILVYWLGNRPQRRQLYRLKCEAQANRQRMTQLENKTV